KLYKGDIYEILSYASRLKVMMELIYHPLEVMITDDSLISVRQMLYEAMSFSYMVYGQTDYPKEPKLVFQQLLTILNKVDYGVSLCTYDYFSAKFYEAEKAFKNSKKDDYQKPNFKKNKGNKGKNAYVKKVNEVYDNVSIKRADGSLQKIRGTYDTGSNISLVRRSIADQVKECPPITIKGIKDC
ncbi:hypothetical protein FOZ63_022117, partial [Perkinsus olseni]